MSSSTSSVNPPIVLTIAGSDSGGGAGIQADLKAFSANGAFGASVITAITAQNTQTVSAVHPVPIDIVAAQIDAVLSDLNVAAIKIGMLFSSELVETVAKHLEGFKGQVVLDPVMIAKSGDSLLEQSAIDALKTILIPRADLLTPNLPEAETLLGQKIHTASAEQATALLDLGAKNVLLKGGHASGNQCVDQLVLQNGHVFEYSAPRVDTQNTHGTGCTYSSTITANLAHGLTMQEAVKQAHTYLHQAILRSDELNVGAGHGPVHHFHQYW